MLLRSPPTLPAPNRQGDDDGLALIASELNELLMGIFSNAINN